MDVGGSWLSELIADEVNRKVGEKGTSLDVKGVPRQRRRNVEQWLHIQIRARLDPGPTGNLATHDKPRYSRICLRTRSIRERTS